MNEGKCLISSPIAVKYLTPISIYSCPLMGCLTRCETNTQAILKLFFPQGVGTVVSGITLQGVVHLNDILLLGPNPLGDFQPIAIKSIHRKRMVVREVRSGQTASFALKKIKRSQIRKGMVLVSPEINPQVCTFKIYISISFYIH